MPVRASAPSTASQPVETVVPQVVPSEKQPPQSAPSPVQPASPQSPIPQQITPVHPGPQQVYPQPPAQGVVTSQFVAPAPGPGQPPFYGQVVQPPQAYGGEKPQMALSTVQEVPQQPQPPDPMSYKPPLTEEEKKQRRAERIAKARKTTGEVCVVCGKVCAVTATVMIAACSIACSIASCMLSCMGSDSPGMGGDGGFSFSMPTD